MLINTYCLEIGIVKIEKKGNIVIFQMESEEGGVKSFIEQFL